MSKDKSLTFSHSIQQLTRNWRWDLIGAAAFLCFVAIVQLAVFFLLVLI